MIYRMVLALACLLFTALSFAQTGLPSFLKGDIFIYGFDNKIDAQGSNLLLLSNKTPIDPGDQFGILGHNNSYSLSENAQQAESALSYISLVYTADNSLPPASKLSLQLLASNNSQITAVKVFHEATEITHNFSIDLVGQNAPLSSSENTSLYLYSGKWLDNEAEGSSLLFGQVIGGIEYSAALDDNSAATVDSQNAVLQIPVSAANSTTGTGGGGPVTITSIFVILDCDGLLFICDIANLLAATDTWVIEEGSSDNDLLIEYLESIICDFGPDPCELGFDLLVESALGPYDCDNQFFPVTVIPHSGTPPFHIVWKNDRGYPVFGGFNRTGASASVNITESGTYTICVTDHLGCVATDTVTYTIPEPLLLEILEDQDICEGEEVTLMATASQGVVPYQYLWSTGSEETEITISDIYEDLHISATVTDDYGCTRTHGVTINVIDPPELSLSWDPCENLLILDEYDIEFCTETFLEKYNANDDVWEVVSSFTNFMQAPSTGKFRVQRVCECDLYYSEPTEVIGLHLYNEKCQAFILQTPCANDVIWCLYYDDVRVYCKSGYLQFPLTLPYNGNWTIKMKCGVSCSYWHTSSVFGQEGCHCSWLTYHQAFEDTTFHSDIIPVTADEEVTFDFYTVNVPDRLIVKVNGKEEINSGNLSSCFTTHAAKAKYCSSAIGLGNCSSYTKTICVYVGDNVQYSVIGNSCNPIDSGSIYTLTTYCKSCTGSSGGGTGTGGGFKIITSTDADKIMGHEEEIKEGIPYENTLISDPPELEEQVSIIPNPADNYVDLVFTVYYDRAVDIEILSTSGQLVLKDCKKQGRNTVRVETQDLLDGLYFIRMQDGNKLISKKLIITHK